MSLTTSPPQLVQLVQVVRTPENGSESEGASCTSSRLAGGTTGTGG